MAGDDLREALRRRRCVELAVAELADARDRFAVALTNLYDRSGLSYAQLAPLFGVTRARIQQLVEHGRTVPSGAPDSV